MKNLMSFVLIAITICTYCTANNPNESNNTMKIHFIRNATFKLSYAGKSLLIDPMLSPKGTMDPFAGKAKNPTVELTQSKEDLIKDIDAVLVTHNHPDHFDTVAQSILSKALPLFVQPVDKAAILVAGFTNVISVENKILWEGITITRTVGQHGSDKMLKSVPQLGTVSGFVLEAQNQPTIYIVGDSVWNEDVNKVLMKHKPNIIVSNSGGAMIPVPGLENDPILMDIEDTITLARASNYAIVVAVHLESLDHCTVTREDLIDSAKKAKISSKKFFVPADGEEIIFSELDYLK